MKRNVNIILILVFFALAFACSKKKTDEPVIPSDKAHIYYVSPNGSDSNTGTINAPFQTINIALGLTVPGDTVMVRGGTYYEKVVFPKSGVMDKFITLKAYRGEKPKIDGTPFSVSGREALVTIDKNKFIVVDGFEICNLKTSTGDPDGILVKGGSDYIIIKNNMIYGIDYTKLPLDGGGNAILIIGNTSDPVTNITVTGNTIHDCRTGYGENLTINGYVDGFTISNNTVYNAENIGIDAAGGYAANPNPALNYARNGVISGNTCYNIESKRGRLGGYGAIGIYVDGAKNIVVEKNRVSVTDRGIGAVSETNGFPTDHVIIRNNLVYNCWRTGIYIGGYLNYTGGGTSNSAIVNNTLYNNNLVIGALGEIEGEISIRQDCSNNVIKNNIIYGGASDMFIHKYNASGSNNIIDYNLYYTTSPVLWTWNGVSYADFNAWKTASGGDAHSTNGVNPLWISTSSFDFHLQSSSAAKNSGQVQSDISGNTDFEGNGRVVNNLISKGAYQ